MTDPFWWDVGTWFLALGMIALAVRVVAREIDYQRQQEKR